MYGINRYRAGTARINACGDSRLRGRRSRKPIGFRQWVVHWDEEKAASNFIKHGIRFETASKVFADENKLIRYDEEHPWEDRYDVLGKIRKVLFVVCTFRKGNVVHIISARCATVSEKARYEHGESYDE